MLMTAVDAGAAYVDVELAAPAAYRRGIARWASAAGCKLIVSHHDYERTPDAATLRGLLERCFDSGADLAKIACMVNASRDNARLLGLLNDEREIVVIGMGAKGRITRIAAPLLGSPFTFASAAAGKETAPGQMDQPSLEKIIRSISV
jgi:3-dehydroquinate dehydratase-1